MTKLVRRKRADRISTWLIDDSVEFTDALSFVLRDEDQAISLSVFHACAPALELLRGGTDPPAVVLLDIEMPELDGLSAIEPLKQESPSTSIIMLTHVEDDEKIRRAIAIGANGYVLKSSPPADVARAVKAAALGGTPIDPFVVGKLLGALSPTEFEKADYKLSPREKEIAHLIVDGLSMNLIAQSLGIGYTTVNTYIKNIHRKLEVRSRGAAVAKILREKLI